MFEELSNLATARMRSEGRGPSRKFFVRSKKEEEALREAVGDLRVRMASEAAKRIDEFVRAPVMEKPEYLPTFIEIRKTLDRVRASRREPSQQQKEIIRDFNLWLEQTLSAEGRDMGTMVFLLDAIEVLEDAQAGHPFARRIEKHIRTVWGIDLPNVLEWPSRMIPGKRELWIRKLVHREDVIPMWLMDGLSVPRDLEDDDEDDDDEEEESEAERLRGATRDMFDDDED